VTSAPERTAEPPVFPATRTCPFDLPDGYAQYREQEGLQRVRIWDGSHHWLVTRHADIKAVLGNPAFSADVRNEDFPCSYANQRVEQAGLLLRLDDPQHAVQRRMLMREFSVKSVQALRPRLAAITDELIDAMLERGGPADLVPALSLPLPSRAICQVLGVPYGERDTFQRFADESTILDTSPEERQRMFAEAFGYYTDLVERKRREPGDDLISRLITEHVADGHLEVAELPNLIFLLVAGGHETTAKMLSLGTLSLLDNPDQRDRLRDEPGLAACAVEELLRFWGVISTDPRRVATEDVEIGGQRVRAGEGVLISLVAGNRDPSVFGADAERLDVARGSRNHLAFGFGSHQCLGQNLARVELEVALPRLFERIPDLRLAVPKEEIEFVHNSIVYGLQSLPLTWG
jgi:cytochrome P450